MGEGKKRGVRTLFILVESDPENIYLSLPQKGRTCKSAASFACSWDFPSQLRLPTAEDALFSLKDLG